jgi:4-hydroxybenzoate polyprenyltransferase
MISNLYLLGQLTAQPTPYYYGLTGVALHLVWQISTVNIDNGRDCWNKFKANAMIGPIFLVGIILANLFRKEGKIDEK